MGTLYPTNREYAAIKERADAGDKSATDYLKLLDACKDVLEASNGIAMARGMLGEHNDVYGHAIDDALGDLMPVIVEICAGGWEGLKWYAPEPHESDPDHEAFNRDYTPDEGKPDDPGYFIL